MVLQCLWEIAYPTTRSAIPRVKGIGSCISHLNMQAPWCVEKMESMQNIFHSVNMESCLKKGMEYCLSTKRVRRNDSSHSQPITSYAHLFPQNITFENKVCWSSVHCSHPTNIYQVLANLDADDTSHGCLETLTNCHMTFQDHQSPLFILTLYLTWCNQNTDSLSCYPFQTIQ